MRHLSPLILRDRSSNTRGVASTHILTFNYFPNRHTLLTHYIIICECLRTRFKRLTSIIQSIVSNQYASFFPCETTFFSHCIHSRKYPLLGKPILKDLRTFENLFGFRSWSQKPSFLVRKPSKGFQNRIKKVPEGSQILLGWFSKQQIFFQSVQSLVDCVLYSPMIEKATVNSILRILKVVGWYILNGNQFFALNSL